MGRTLSSLLSKFNLKNEEFPQLNAGLFKEYDAEDEWRIPLGKELLQLADIGNLDLPGLTFEEQEEILNHNCVT